MPRMHCVGIEPCQGGTVKRPDRTTRPERDILKLAALERHHGRRRLSHPHHQEPGNHRRRGASKPIDPAGPPRQRDDIQHVHAAQVRIDLNQPRPDPRSHFALVSSSGHHVGRVQRPGVCWRQI